MGEVINTICCGLKMYLAAQNIFSELISNLAHNFSSTPIQNFFCCCWHRPHLLQTGLKVTDYGWLTTDGHSCEPMNSVPHVQCGGETCTASCLYAVAVRMAVNDSVRVNRFQARHFSKNEARHSWARSLMLAVAVFFCQYAWNASNEIWCQDVSTTKTEWHSQALSQKEKPGTNSKVKLQLGVPLEKSD